MPRIHWRASISVVLCTFLISIGHVVAVDNNAAVITESASNSEDISKKDSNQAEAVAVTPEQWDDFQPPRDEKYDWLQLESGEWVKGELISLYNFIVEFDSDELDLLKIDWEDVRQIRSAGLLSLRVETSGDGHNVFTIVGVLQLKDDSAVVLIDQQVKTLERDQIVSIAKGTGKESDLWVGKISFGANVKSGNTDTVDTNLVLGAKRRTSKSRFSIDYVGNFSRTQSIETSNNHRLNSHFDKFYNSKFFWRTYSAEYYRDTFKNIDQQFSLSSSFGYHLIRTSKTEWEISGGLGALYTRFESVEAGNDIDNTSPFLELGTLVDTTLTNWMDFLLDYKFQLVDEDSGSYTHHFVTTLSSDITNDLELDISLVWDRIAKPQPAADGTVPDKDDSQLIVGLSYEF